jgi:NAD(P)-dependent dehydrogenase (short-subunit alcohol dehydrogenase family)
MLDLRDRTAIVTGAASGIGGGIAEVLAQAGALVVVADRNGEAARAKAQALTAAGGKADWITVELSDEASIVAACAEVVRRHGAPWALVNNAGLQDRELLLEGTAAFWDRILSVNTRGAYLMTREVARAMVEAGTGGRIVNIGSIAIEGGVAPGHAAYAASKTALLGLTNVCALELVGHGITVNIVLPGGVATPGAIQAVGPPPTGPATRRPPLGLCDPRDIGGAVAYFASDLAVRTTNQCLTVDAGWSIA